MQIIYADDIQTVNEVMYGSRSDILLNDLRSNLSNYDQSILTDLGRRYEVSVKENFEAVSGWRIVNATRKAVAGVQGFDAPDVITPMYTDEAFLKTPVLMQRFIMADPVIRELYHKKRIDGWSDTYVDNYPKVIGPDHLDYRIVKHGIVERTVTPENVTQYAVTEFKHSIGEREVKLSASNQLDLCRTTMFVRSKMSRGKNDLTSLYDEEVS